MATMRAVLVGGDKTAKDLYIGDSPKPSPSADQVLVKVGAFGINRADTLQRTGGYPPPAGASTIMGLEIAGTVEEVGANVTVHQVGDRVFGYVDVSLDDRIWLI
jgi:NADPH:quinone reductase-like Zn-dependent oxidoreductase